MKRELLDQRNAKVEEARALNALAEAENRDFTADEQAKWDGIQDEIAKLDRRIERAKALPEVEPQRPTAAPAVLTHKRGDNFDTALGAYLRSGDVGGLREYTETINGNIGVTIPGNYRDAKNLAMQYRASNATDMNITTAADGGYTVPTGLYNEVIAKRTEISLPERIGVRRIPGRGTTINVPYDNETDGELVSTAEAGAFDLDAPAIGQAAMTLVKYSKYLKLSDELLNDEDANIMSFLADWIARGQAKTLNQLLLTEAAASGTAYVTTASATAIAAGELEGVYMNDYIGDYLDDSGSVAWISKPSTYGSIISIAGSTRFYLPQVQGDISPRNILGYPVFFSSKAGALTASQKSVYFGNWNLMGWREAPSLTILRDPYSAASTGQVVMWMYMRTVFKVLQPYAIGYLLQHA